MTMTTADVSATGGLGHAEAMALQGAELVITLRLLESLGEDDWAVSVPACPQWDVRRMYLHVLGACEGAAFGQMVYQMQAAMRRRRREGGPLEASLSAVQVTDRDALAPADLLERLQRVAPRVVRQRGRIPGVVRTAGGMTVDGPVVERWKLGYLIDTIYLRDMWMHRIDACAALGRAPELTAEHDGRIVADVVAEWARRHGRPFNLELTGPAGGRFASGEGAEADQQLSLDAIAFCQLLSGRVKDSPPPSPLLATVVPF